MSKTDRLGRRVQFDERSRAFPIRAIIPQTKPRSYTWSVGQWLDQGYEGACVGFAWTHELIARPRVAKGLTAIFARDVYRLAQRIDEWPGEDYEGTSVLAGVKVVKRLGYIKEYRWAFGLDDLRMAVGYKGPAVIGVNWYEGMLDPDGSGYIMPTGQVVGGHAILVFSNSEKHGRFTVWNSWGKSWGRDGTAYISHGDMGRLLSEQGEACIPTLRG